jgi:hypothetical protein
MIFVVEVLAIYEDPGVTPSNPRVNQRDNDVAEAKTRSAAVTHYVATGQDVPPEHITAFGRAGDAEPSSRYGFGWRARLWLNVRQDGDDIGQAVAARLATRSLRQGSYVQVFEHLADEAQPYATGALLFSATVGSGL